MFSDLSGVLTVTGGEGESRSEHVPGKPKAAKGISKRMRASMYVQMADDGFEDIFLFFKVAKMTSPRLPAPETHFVPNLVKQFAITKLEHSLVRIRCIAFPPPPP